MKKTNYKNNNEFLSNFSDRLESLPKIKSHGMTVGIIMPDDEVDLK